MKPEPSRYSFRFVFIWNEVELLKLSVPFAIHHSPFTIHELTEELGLDEA